MVLEDLYQDVILDHFKHPRHRGKIESPSACYSLLNPLCGDQIEMSLKLDGDSVKQVAFSGHGCAISQAAASMLSECCEGKTKAEALEVLGKYKKMMSGEGSFENEPALGDTIALAGVRNFPARIRCALLACEALEKCLVSDR